jgi:hypothetical protein
MRRTLVLACAFALLIGAGAALGGTGSAKQKAIVLQPGQAVSFAGLTCTAYAGSTSTNGNLVCVRNNLAGFGVIVSQQTILVAKRSGTKLKVVFKTKNR